MSEKLVARLREAAKAYYETDTPIMSDAEYDELIEELRSIKPNHPFLNEVGATPGVGVVSLPVPMPSLDKKKPDTLKCETGSYVLMDKLDGISALWCGGYNRKPALYLRGNGTEGQDVSHCIGGIQGLRPCAAPSIMVRGELIVPRGVITGTLARSWVNGVLHQKTPSRADLEKIHFVAYQVCEPRSLSRSEQMTWLVNQGFEVAWNLREFELTADKLCDLFKKRRAESLYECDGIVVGQDKIPTQEASNPKDAFAFKMPLDDQRASTTVVDVEWTSSRTGNWIPRVKFEPVKIGTASIEYCTGFNAKFIAENGVGPGARILVRRSGDVIPTLEKVLSSVAWKKPPADCWKWDATETHALDTSTSISPEKLALEMAHQLVCLGVEGFSKTSTKKLVDDGMEVLHDVYTTAAGKLQSILGKVNGEKLRQGLETAVKSATEAQWIKAYLGWPKGFGDARIENCLTLEKYVEKWPEVKSVPKGMSSGSFEEIKKAVPGYLKWRGEFPVTATVPDKVSVVAAPAPTTTMPNMSPVHMVTLSNGITFAPNIRGYYVMSGFRDADLQKRLHASGWKLDDKVKKTTKFLLVPDDARETTKVKAARDAGIQILARSEAETILNNQ
jgi:DNA ligase (NAD+)